MNSPEPIKQRPIVRPEYTDPRKSEFYLWKDTNRDKIRKYFNSLCALEDDEFDVFALIQYETELLRRDMKE